MGFLSHWDSDSHPDTASVLASETVSASPLYWEASELMHWNELSTTGGFSLLEVLSIGILAGERRRNEQEGGVWLEEGREGETGLIREVEDKVQNPRKGCWSCSLLGPSTLGNLEKHNWGLGDLWAEHRLDRLQAESFGEMTLETERRSTRSWRTHTCSWKNMDNFY